jgi:hypothetical protein
MANTSGKLACSKMSVTSSNGKSSRRSTVSDANTNSLVLDELTVLPDDVDDVDEEDEVAPLVSIFSSVPIVCTLPK